MENIIKRHLYLIIVLTLTLLVVLWFILINNGEYGTTLFFTIPASIGFLIGYLQRYKVESNKRFKTIIIGFIKIISVIAILSCLLIALGMEGAICILMAFPFLVIPMFIAYLIGVFIANADSKNKLNSIIFIILINPTTYIYDSYTEPINDVIVTELIINASKEDIWKNLTTEITFKNNPNLIFRKGVTFPKSIKFINNKNELNYNCQTNNDTISLKITELVLNKKVKFTLDNQPVPMKEITPYNSIDAKHLHDYFVVNYGEIKLESLNSNTTKLIAKTSYDYKIAPKWYWTLWSNYIVDEMQLHVLASIKNIYNE